MRGRKISFRYATCASRLSTEHSPKKAVISPPLPTGDGVSARCAKSYFVPRVVAPVPRPSVHVKQKPVAFLQYGTQHNARQAGDNFKQTHMHDRKLLLLFHDPSHDADPVNAIHTYSRNDRKRVTRGFPALEKDPSLLLSLKQFSVGSAYSKKTTYSWHDGARNGPAIYHLPLTLAGIRNTL